MPNPCSTNILVKKELDRNKLNFLPTVVMYRSAIMPMRLPDGAVLNAIFLCLPQGWEILTIGRERYAHLSQLFKCEFGCLKFFKVIVKQSERERGNSSIKCVMKLAVGLECTYKSFI